MKISVIMPVYNEEKYIDEAIQSWINQSLEEKELICIDDGSTDRTVEIISQYREKYPNIILLKQDRQGAGAARNRGLRYVTGEFVCFLDADDFFVDRNGLRLLYQTAKEHDVNVCAGLLQIHKKEEIIFNSVLRNLLENKKKAKIRYEDFQYDYQYQCYIFKDAFLKENNLEFPLFKRFQDPPFLVQALYKAKEFMLIPVEFYGYRYDEKKITYNIEKTNDLFRGLLFNLKFAYEMNLKKLYSLTLRRINEDYFNVLYTGLQNKNFTLLKLLLEAQDIVNNTKEEIEVLNALFSTRNLYDGVYLKKNKFEQEVEEILSTSNRVVIYGAGNIGKQCYQYITRNNQYKLIGWVDLYKSGETIDGYTIQNISKLMELEYECVFIALENEMVRRAIKNDLLNMGVLQDRIKEWKG